MPRSEIYARSGSNSLSACMRVILKPRYSYSLLTCLIPSSMFFNFRFLIIINMENIMCWDMVFRNTMSLTWMSSHHRVTFLYPSRIPLWTFGTMIGSIWWTLWRMFCLGNMAHWLHRCPQLYQNILIDLGDYVGYFYQPHVGLVLLGGRWCDGTALRNHPSLYIGRCNVSYFTPIVGWGSVNNSPCFAHYFCFLEGASYFGRRNHPWSS